MYQQSWQQYFYYNPNYYGFLQHDASSQLNLLQMNQEQLFRLMDQLQSQVEDIQTKITSLEQSPKNTYVQNDFCFDNLEINLDTISIEALTGSMQIGLINGVPAQPAVVPAPAIPPVAAPAPVPALPPEEVPPEEVPPEEVPPVLPPTPPVVTAPPPIPIPPGIGPPGGVLTVIPPGLIPPPGSVQISPGLAILPPGTTPIPPAG